MIACQLLQCVETVVYEYAAWVVGILLLVYHSIGATLLKSHGCKLVSVERLALEGKEQRAFRTVAAVGSHDIMLGEDFVKFGYFHNI